MEINTSTYSGPERRRYKRILYCSYSCYRKSHKDIEFKQAKIINIGQGGMLLETREKLNLDNLLEVKLYIPYAKGSHFVTSIVKPVWYKKTKVKGYWCTGVEFQYLDSGTKDILTKFVESLKTNNTTLPQGLLKKEFLRLPYWCVVKQSKILEKYFPKAKSRRNSYNVIFESERKYPPHTQIELELKIPPITMPFKTRGIVLDTKQIKQESNYIIYLQLNNLLKEQLEAMKRFTPQ